MLFSFAILLILCGLGIMGFGLFLFYAWLPLFYGFVGLEIGLLLGKWVTGGIGPLAVTLGTIGGLLAASTAHYFEPYRRTLLGYIGGALFLLSLAATVGLDRVTHGFVSAVVSVAGGLIGATIARHYFDPVVVGVSAVGGATLVMAGAQMLLPIAEASSGSLLPIVLTAILALIGISWQLKNMATWVSPGSLR
ncbi:MAG: hypothetical protein HC869_13315 [Rhodospirillales bacterium]|nr:hypothetical protein [Rhodospirillales bacterium]